MLYRNPIFPPLPVNEMYFMANGTQKNSLFMMLGAVMLGILRNSCCNFLQEIGLYRPSAARLLSERCGRDPIAVRLLSCPDFHFPSLSPQYRVSFDLLTAVDFSFTRWNPFFPLSQPFSAGAFPRRTRMAGGRGTRRG